MPLPRLAVLALLCLSAVPAAAQTASSTDSIGVSVEGAVRAPGLYKLPAKARIDQAIAAARPGADAYVLGAALLRRQALTEQVRLKAGLQYDLKQLANSGDKAISGTAATLSAWLESLPVTGRAPRQLLELRLLQIQPKYNPVAFEGDRVIYPVRPTQVQVVGAVVQPCALQHVPEQDVLAYLRACPGNPAADRDTAYIVQPDGNVQVAGIALWNRSPPQPLAPGAILYVPLTEYATRTVDPEFNRQFAEFLATQVLPAPGASL